MTPAKHTVLPLRLSERFTEEGPVSGRVVVSVGANYRHIATFYGPFGGAAERDANATLFVASARLLDALEGVAGARRNGPCWCSPAFRLAHLFHEDEHSSDCMAARTVVEEIRSAQRPL